MFVRSRWVLGLGVALSTASGAHAQSTQSVPVFVDGNRLGSNALLLRSVNRTVVPMRTLFESLGARVEWDSSERAVYAWNPDGSGVRLPLRELFAQTMEMSESPGPGNWGRVVSRYSLDAPAQLVDRRVYVPLRFASEALKADVRYAAYRPAVHIRTQAVAGSREETEIDPEPLVRDRVVERDQIIERDTEELDSDRVIDRDRVIERDRIIERDRVVDSDRILGRDERLNRLVSGLDVSVRVRERRLQRGGNVLPITFVVRNNSNRRVVVPFPTEQQFDVEILRDGELIWNWARGRRFTRGESALTVERQEDVEFEVRWDLRDNSGRAVRPGEYTVRGSLTTDTGERLSAERPLTIDR